MVAGLARSELQTSYKAGVGKVRERTLVLGAQVIAIDNIGSIRLIESGRSWWLAFVGLIIAGGAGSQVLIYGPIAWAGLGLGLVLVLINMLVPVEHRLAIGVSDGRTAMVISQDAAFLRRLLDLLLEKINSRNETLIANFDITNNTVFATESEVAAAPPAPRKPAAIAESVAPQAISASETEIASAYPENKPTPDTVDIDDALFASESAAPLKPRAAPERPVAAQVARVSAPQISPHDPMLDGPSIASHASQREQRDWLNEPRRIVYEGDQGSRPNSLRWMLPVLLFAVLVGGGIAAWMTLRNPDGAMSISLMTPTATGPAERITLADAVADAAVPPLPAAATAPTEPVIAASATPTSIAAWSPGILEPAGGVELSGGEQSVRLAWTANASATAYIVEIQTFDPVTQQWIDEARPRRLTLQSAAEVAEAFAAGDWRWRVRGVSRDGEQSEFSRWAAFSVSN